MSIFFLWVGLEIKAEMIQGELSDFKKACLPGISALGGMIFPALIFMLINHQAREVWPAWSVPVATDIAFSLAVLQLFGQRIPLGLKLFLLALATFDDLGAVAIIAIFYTHALNFWMLGASLLTLAVLWLANLLHSRRLSLFFLLGIVLWICMAKSGVDAVIAGVFLALTIPASMCRRLYEELFPWVNYLVLPLFALANAGVHFANIPLQALMASLPLGIIFGLVIGKPLGVFGVAYGVVRLGYAELPAEVNWSNFLGMSFLCGIGFTMSLLLGELAFHNPDLLVVSQIKAGILIGSLVSAIVGAGWFYFTVNHHVRKE
jgi:NhaA family Na+:H+ antiporter